MSESISHEAETGTHPPHGCTWGRYLGLLSAGHGGWTALVDLLIHRAHGLVELPDDPQSIERGLRRLARRNNAPGGQYGRWVLRFFGVPLPLDQAARWMGQYHQRFADLPTSLCESQLWLWDRPPICESRVAAWIHLGLASVAMRRSERDVANARVAQARSGAAAAGPAAEVEVELLTARLASDIHDTQGVAHSLERASELLPSVEPKGERACYQARLLDQRAYAILHPRDGTTPDVPRGRELYDAIPALDDIPFVMFRRSHGLAYCNWKLGEREQAKKLALAACSHAGDGGLIRFRAMALRLLAHLVPAHEAVNVRRRAQKMAQRIEHEDLLQHLTRGHA